MDADDLAGRMAEEYSTRPGCCGRLGDRLRGCWTKQHSPEAGEVRRGDRPGRPGAGLGEC
jgi:hypothetical protein